MEFYESEIPKIFKTFVSEEPFEKCINCECNLLEEGRHYMIEKAIKSGIVEFEHAICIDCAQEMQLTMSEESSLRVNEFFKNNFDEKLRMEELYSEGEPSTEKWMKNCIISNDNIDDIDEYQIYAHCHGDKLVFSVTPFILSGKVVEQMAELLSAKTKDELDDYMDKHFNIPPEWKEAIKNKKIFLL